MEIFRILIDALTKVIATILDWVISFLLLLK